MARKFLPFLILLAGCGKPAPTSAPTKESFAATFLGNKPGLHNLIQVNDWLYTGSEPEGDAGFQSLSALNIRTIITVDGTPPDLARARKLGIRYVHIPIGYNAIPQDRVLLIAKAMKELPKPIYLHCHHGKHRGPAAAMAGVRCIDPQCSLANSLSFMKLAGTDPEYSELFASVEKQRVLQPQDWNAVPSDYPASAPVPDFVGKMIELDNTFQKLKKTHAKDRQDAIALREAYRELQRDAAQKPEEFRKWLQQGERLAEELVQLETEATVKKALDASANVCVECHKQFRNHTAK